MEYRIEKIDFELRIVGKGKTVKTSRAHKSIPTLWNAAKKEGFMQELIDLSWENPKCTLESLLGICGKEAAITDDEFVYFMGVRYDGKPPNGLDFLVIPSGTWAVFPHIAKGWERINAEGISLAVYELANLPCIECYYPPKHKPKHELWVPIVTK